MWIAETGGFVSIVEKPADKGKDTLTVRSRDKRSLQVFLEVALEEDVPLESIEFDMATDYPYRRVIGREQAAHAAYEFVMAIDYSNFKNAAKERRGAVFASVLSKVWTALLGLEDKETRKEINARLKEKPLIASTWSSPQGTVVQPGDDDWATILDVDEAAELAELDDLVSTLGVHALTDEQWARKEELEAGD